MTSIAIIPARGGSKRIPRKNIKPFCGKPMLAYPLAAARESGLFSRILVSTDDREIADAAREYGGEAPFVRPAELSDDRTGTSAVIAHALEWLGGRGERPDLVCCIYATTPFLRPFYLRQGCAAIAEGGASSSIAVAEYPHPIERAWRPDTEGFLRLLQPDQLKTRSQDLPPAFYEAGQFYWAAVPAFLERRSFLTAKTAPVLLPRCLVQDIDSEEDWRRAELMYAALEQSGWPDD